MAAAEILQTTLSDVELIDLVVNGDREAFEVLYDRYFHRVFAFCSKRLNNRADAEETTQEVFINVFSALASFRNESPFAAWVLGVARRTVANRFKKKRHQTVPFDDVEEPDNVDPLKNSMQRSATPLESYECTKRIDQLNETARRELSAEQLLLFEMHHIHHKSIQQIALEMSKSEDAIKSNLYRSRKLLLA